MARVGPNQDINDPTTIVDVLREFHITSLGAADFLASSNAQNPNVRNFSPLIEVSIPFQKVDGSTQLLLGSLSGVADTLILNSDLIFNSVINTYINLAERFRDYWEIFNNVLDQLNDFDFLGTTEIEEEETTVNLGGGQTRIHGSLGGTANTFSEFSHSPPQSLLTPDWTGDGPTDYNQNTYPQLITEVRKLNIQRTVLQRKWDTIYWFGKFTDGSGSVRSASARFGKSESFGPPLNEQYIQIHNSGLSIIEIELSLEISASFNTRFSAVLTSWAEIGDINVFPDPFGGFKFSLDSFISESQELLAPGGTINLDATRTVEIPPGKSVFMGCTAGASTTFGGSSIASVDITLILDNQTITHSADLT